MHTSFKGEAPQFDALKKDTDLVLLSIGATDVNFAGYGLTCVLSNCTGAPTRTILDAAPRMGESLKALLQDIRARSPRAKIILTGYGRMVTTGPNAEGVRHDQICDPSIFTAAEREQGGQVMTTIDRTLTEAAAAARSEGVDVAFVSPYADSKRVHPSFEGHSLCEDKDPYYRGFDALQQEGADAVLHLNRAGHAALADLIQAQVRV